MCDAAVAGSKTGWSRNNILFCPARKLLPPQPPALVVSFSRSPPPAYSFLATLLCILLCTSSAFSPRFPTLTKTAGRRLVAPDASHHAFGAAHTTRRRDDRHCSLSKADHRDSGLQLRASFSVPGIAISMRSSKSGKVKDSWFVDKYSMPLSTIRSFLFPPPHPSLVLLMLSIHIFSFQRRSTLDIC